MSSARPKSVQVNQFDRGKPFYALVANYVVSLHGVLDLVSRHMVATTRGTVSPAGPFTGPSAPYLYEPGEMEVPEERLHAFYGDPSNRQITPLISPLALRSEMQGGHIEIDAAELAAETFQNARTLLPAALTSAGVLLISSYETTKMSSDGAPVWEFLRHCRNAASHGGRFHFLHGEPRSPASWGPFQLTAGMHGSRLFNDPPETGLLSPGDPIRLLWDIEQAYFRT